MARTLCTARSTNSQLDHCPEASPGRAGSRMRSHAGHSRPPVAADQSCAESGLPRYRSKDQSQMSFAVPPPSQFVRNMSMLSTLL